MATVIMVPRAGFAKKFLAILFCIDALETFTVIYILRKRKNTNYTDYWTFRNGTKIQ